MTPVLNVTPAFTCISRDRLVSSVAFKSSTSDAEIPGFYVTGGQLSLCFCPGKCVVRDGVKHTRDLQEDLHRLRDGFGVTCVLCLLNLAELRVSQHLLQRRLKHTPRGICLHIHLSTHLDLQAPCAGNTCHECGTIWRLTSHTCCFAPLYSPLVPLPRLISHFGLLPVSRALA